MVALVDAALCMLYTVVGIWYPVGGQQRAADTLVCSSAHVCLPVCTCACLQACHLLYLCLAIKPTRRLRHGTAMQQPNPAKGFADTKSCLGILAETARLDCAQVIFGGRSDIDYFNDVWAYRLSTATWEDWTPVAAESAAPLGRDHFGAVYNAGHIYIYGMLFMTSRSACHCQHEHGTQNTDWLQLLTWAAWAILHDVTVALPFSHLCHPRWCKELLVEYRVGKQTEPTLIFIYETYLLLQDAGTDILGMGQHAWTASVCCYIYQRGYCSRG